MLFTHVLLPYMRKPTSATSRLVDFFGGNCGHLAQNNTIKCKTTRNNDNTKQREITQINAKQRKAIRNNA